MVRAPVPPEHPLRRIGGTESYADLLKFPGVSGPYELEGRNPKLKLIREILLIPPEPVVAECPTAVRLYIRFLAARRALSRKGMIVLH